MNRTVIHGIGLMCGTSLDGLDIAHCTFNREDGAWSYACNAAHEVPLPNELKSKLSRATTLADQELKDLDTSVGSFFADSVVHFLTQFEGPTDFIASHGVTVFHQPENGITLQIGSGEIMANQTGITTVSDFRSEDVSKGGQGAPLVPYPDSMLFNEYNATLNLGGFANVAILDVDNLTGFDICPCNKILNQLAQEFDGSEFDRDGAIARSGSLNIDLLNTLNSIPFYQQNPPKSLGHEWYIDMFMPLLNADISIPDKMHTVVEHIAFQIGQVLPAQGSILIAGGGAHNSYLVDRIQSHTRSRIVIPEDEMINFKEAIDFAFLGALRLENLTNIKSRVTGASSDSIAGTIHLPS